MTTGLGAPYIRPNFGKNAPTGIKNNTTIKAELSLYPNPASEQTISRPMEVRLRILQFIIYSDKLYLLLQVMKHQNRV